MKCPDCGKEFSALGRHLAFADCSPTVTSYQHDVLRGVLMSDGWVGTSGRCLQAEWANKKYAKYVSDELEWLCDGVQKRSNRDIWQLSTVSCDYIENNFSWYSSGQKRWPLNKKLTDDTLKHLYAGDGHLKQREGRSDEIII